jgi:hypothetical protein
MQLAAFEINSPRTPLSSDHWFCTPPWCVSLLKHSLTSSVNLLYRAAAQLINTLKINRPEPKFKIQKNIDRS